MLNSAPHERQNVGVSIRCYGRKLAIYVIVINCLSVCQSDFAVSVGPVMYGWTA